MSEKLNLKSVEVENLHEKESKHHEQHNKLKHNHEKGTEASKDLVNNIDQIKQSIEASALSKDQYNSGNSETKQPHTYRITKQIKQDAYQRTLKHAQKHMSKTEKAFSKTIHNPVVEKVSDVGAKTIARPSGLLFGSLLAFISSTAVLYISKHNGFKYNFLFFAIIFIGGYFCGLILELFYKSFKSKKN